MDAANLENTSNIDITLSEKELVADIEKAAALTESRNSNIHFGLLGHGITCYDTSRMVNGDYPTVAHISNGGNIKYYSDDLSANDKRLIEEQAARQKRKFIEEWNKLPIESRYNRLLDAADEMNRFADVIHSDLSSEEAVAKFERSLIFRTSLSLSKNRAL